MARTDHKMVDIRSNISRFEHDSVAPARMFRIRQGAFAVIRGGSVPTLLAPRDTLVSASSNEFGFYPMTAWPLLLIGTVSGITRFSAGYGVPKSRGIRINMTHVEGAGKRRELQSEGLQDLYFRCGQYLPSKSTEFIDPRANALREVASTATTFASGGTSALAGHLSPAATSTVASGITKIVESAAEAAVSVLGVTGFGSGTKKSGWNETKYPPLFYVEFKSFQEEGFKKLEFSKRGAPDHRDPNHPQRTLYKWKHIYGPLSAAIAEAYSGRRTK